MKKKIIFFLDPETIEQPSGLLGEKQTALDVVQKEQASEAEPVHRLTWESETVTQKQHSAS